MKPYLVILYLMACVIVGASGDGLMDDGAKLWGHGLNALETALLISGAFVFNLNRKQWLAFIVAYVAFRIVGFDYAYNLSRGLPWDFIGFTSGWDLFLKKQLPSGVLFGRALFLILGVSVSLRNFK